MSDFPSWGRYPGGEQQGAYLASRRHAFPAHEGSVLPYGLGRSYGTSCQNLQGTVLSTKQLNQFIAFDPDTGILHCEAGVTLAEILTVFIPKGWFLPVTPGTKYVTVAGAIANDVHGKNHVQAGSFSCHLHGFYLLRSDGTHFYCSATDNSEWFAATVGGIGLTGIISSALIQLKKINSRFVDSETIKYANLDEFFSLSDASEHTHEYTAAWLDCLAKGEHLGRGHFIRGNHADDGELALAKQKAKLSMPIVPPVSLVNGLSLRAFNQLYYHRQQQPKKQSKVDYDPFFYPLDGILHWNRMYGKNGFVQYQCVIPKAQAKEAIRAILQRISHAGEGSFLVVLKMMGDKAGKGLLSFPQEGVTLAIDFPFRGQKTLALLSALDTLVLQAAGRLYIAKDARMSADVFRRSYPQWQQLETMRDPAILSDFWRKVAL